MKIIWPLVEKMRRGGLKGKIMGSLLEMLGKIFGPVHPCKATHI